MPIQDDDLLTLIMSLLSLRCDGRGNRDRVTATSSAGTPWGFTARLDHIGEPTDRHPSAEETT